MNKPPVKVENLVRPQGAKRIREKFGLTQREAGATIGGRAPVCRCPLPRSTPPIVSG
jgi:hypothetical protein